MWHRFIYFIYLFKDPSKPDSLSTRIMIISDVFQVSCIAPIKYKRGQFWYAMLIPVFWDTEQKIMLSPSPAQPNLATIRRIGKIFSRITFFLSTQLSWPNYSWAKGILNQLPFSSIFTYCMTNIIKIILEKNIRGLFA